MKLVIECPPLPDFGARDVEVVRAAFAGAEPCALGQAWCAELEPGFAPGQVRAGWRRDSLLVFAELTDHDVHSAATGINQRTWEFGDTFEMFLRPDGQEEYFEFHVTPNNYRLQLRFPSSEALRRAQAANAIDEFLLPGEVFNLGLGWSPTSRSGSFLRSYRPSRSVVSPSCGPESAGISPSVVTITPVAGANQ